MKQRSLFMDERDKLSNSLLTERNPSRLTSVDDDDDDDADGKALHIDESIKSSDSIPFVEEVVIENTEASLSRSSSQHSDDEDHDQSLENGAKIPDDYELPDLPPDLKMAVEQKDVKQFAPHTFLRKVLLNLIYNDVAKKHNLL